MSICSILPNEVLLSKLFKPQENLAAEARLLRERSRPLMLLWRSRPAVVIGRNQFFEAEVDLAYAEIHQIDLVRRYSGGGAVYQDLGCVNISLIFPGELRILGEVVPRLIPLLGELGVDAKFNSHNDIMVGERKISGWAAENSSLGTIVHGSLLVNSNLVHLGRVLTPGVEKLARHGVDSVRSRVANLNEFLPDLTAEKFIDYCCGKFIGR